MLRLWAPTTTLPLPSWITHFLCWCPSQVMEEMSANSSWSRDLRSADILTKALLRVVETEGPGVLTSTDVTFLSQMVDLDRVPQGSSSGTPRSETMVSVATNYLKLASLVLEPQTASWWLGPTDDGVRGTSSVFVCCSDCSCFSSYYRVDNNNHDLVFDSQNSEIRSQNFDINLRNPSSILDC